MKNIHVVNKRKLKKLPKQK